jgi:hypothetical protein
VDSLKVEAAAVKQSDNPASLLAGLKDGLVHQDGDRVWLNGVSRGII